MNDSLPAQIRELKAQIAAVSTLMLPPSTLQSLQDQLVQLTGQFQQVQHQLATTPPRPKPVSEGLRDLLRDKDGISFHRFQMLAWTVVLTVVYARAVYANLTMPDFDATLLGLMGVSSGTYIGFKLSDPK